MKVKRVRVGDVLKLQRRPVEVDTTTEYTLIGIYSFGKGIFHREPKLGAELGDYKFFSIEPDDLVLSNIQAWEGAIGLATERDCTTVGTHRFLSYIPRDGRIDTDWARWFFLSEPGAALIRQAAPGSTARNRTLSIDRFENLEIPLPEIDKQREAAAHLDRIQFMRDRVSSLARSAATLLGASARSLATRPDLSDEKKRNEGWEPVRLGSVLALAADPVSVEPGGAYPNLGIYSFGRGVFRKPPIDGGNTSAKTLYRVHEGQFIYSRLFAFEGAYSHITKDFDGAFVSNEFPTFNPDSNRLDVRWLSEAFRSPDLWSEIAAGSKGLGVRRQRVPVPSILAHNFWLPPIGYQRTAVKKMTEIDAAHSKHKLGDARLKAVLPAALNKAFGDLR